MIDKTFKAYYSLLKVNFVLKSSEILSETNLRINSQN